MGVQLGLSQSSDFRFGAVLGFGTKREKAIYQQMFPGIIQSGIREARDREREGS